MLVSFFVCVVLHELGHCFTAIRYGITVPRILLLPIGGMAEFDGIPREPRRELLITVAGPAVNFVLAALLWLVLPRLNGAPGSDAETEIPTLLESAHLLMKWNLAMGLFNLLPAFPMDGGRILRAALATRLNYVRATFWAATTGKVLCVIGAGVALFYRPTADGEAFHNPLLAVLFAFIFFVGEMEYRAARRRELEEAHWRAVLARHFAATAATPLEDPPVLRP
jgi:Zn-dependent protease